MNDFTASNGDEFVVNPSGSLDIETNVQPGVHISPALTGSLREFFQAEADERLSRWRWPENPDYVVYEAPGGCRIFQESTGQYFSWSRTWLNNEGIMQNESAPAARAYFDAHPEPKQIPTEPRTAWVDKYGTDVWHVGVDGVIRCVLSPGSDPAKYAPFTRLVPEEQQ